MLPATADLLKSVLALPEAELRALADAFRAAYPPSDADEVAFQAELDRRSDALDSGEAVGIPWPIAREQAREYVEKKHTRDP